MRASGIAFVIVIVLAACSSAMAQAQGGNVERLERSMRQAQQQYQLLANRSLSIDERAVVEYGGLASFALLAIDDIDQSTNILRQTDVQLFAGVNIDGAHEFYGRLRYTYNDFNSGDSFDGLGDEQENPWSDRWWYKFDLRRAIESSEGVSPDYNVTVQAGRQWIDWASGLVLSDQLYAVRATVEVGPFELEGLAGMTPSSSVIDFDSSRPEFDHDTDRNFFGGKLAFNGIEGHKLYAFGLVQEDMNDQDTRNVPINLGGGLVVGVPTRFRYDSYYIGVGSTGAIVPRLLYVVEFVYEGGDGLSTSLVADDPFIASQTTEDIEAWAVKLELHYLLRDAGQTRFEFEVLAASGDDDRLLDTSNTVGGNKSGTSDKSFNGFGFAKTGLAFAAPISNLLMFRGGASTFPLRNGGELVRNLQVGIDMFVFNKLDSDAPLDQPTNDDMYLGFETDIFAAWRITSDVALNVRYGVFFPGAGIDTDHDTRNFFYMGVSYSF